MRKFRVVVNGEVFEVEVEEITPSRLAPPGVPPTTVVREAAPGPSAPATGEALPLRRRTEASAGTGVTPVAPPPEVLAEGEVVRAPLPGAVSDVKVHPGQTVQVGDVLVILEAMKMENEIPAPLAGIVLQVVAQKGATVNTGDPLVVIGRA